MSDKIFLDTVGLLALWDKSDQWHESATRAYETVDASAPDYYPTAYILLECANAAARRPFRSTPDRLRARIEGTESLVQPTLEDWLAAWEAYGKGGAAQAGIVDNVSFIVMRRLGIQRAFTNDKHFKAAGFETLF